MTVVDRDGEPVPGARVHYRPEGWPAAWSAVAPDGRGVAPILADEPGIDVHVVAPGYRSSSRKNVQADITLKLDPVVRCRVDVRLRPASPLPNPPFALEARLQWAGPVDSSAAPAPGAKDPRDPPRPGRASSYCFTTDRKVSFEVWDPGRYRVELVLTRGGLERPLATEPRDPIVTVSGDGLPVNIELVADEADLRRRFDDDR